MSIHLISRTDFVLAEIAGHTRTEPLAYMIRIRSDGPERWERVAIGVDPRCVSLAFNDCKRHPGHGTVMEVCRNCEQWRDDSATGGPDCFNGCRERGLVDG